jgi:tRNA G10  N-methylase Trm11
MARLARIQPGQTVFDPMMGVGTIPIGTTRINIIVDNFVEAAEVWKDALVLGGDIAEECVTKAVANVKDCGVHVDFVRWNVTGLPLRNGTFFFYPNSNFLATIDVTLSDIPFGRRSGFHKQNKKLYPKMFRFGLKNEQKQIIFKES